MKAKQKKERRAPNKFPGTMQAGDIRATHQIEITCQRMAMLVKRRKAIVDELLDLQETVTKYMGDKERLFDPTGVIMNATYIPYVREDFDKKEFAEDQPKLYAKYLRKKTVRKFLLK